MHSSNNEVILHLPSASKSKYFICHSALNKKCLKLEIQENWSRPFGCLDFCNPKELSYATYTSDCFGCGFEISLFLRKNAVGMAW